MTNSRNPSIVSAVAAILLTTLALTPAAAAARSIYVRDEGRLHYTGSSGSLLHEEGIATGNLPGKLDVHFLYTGSLTVTAQFTISGNGWSLTGHGTGALHNPNAPSPSFRGAMAITGGTGHYAHAHATGELFGVFYRHSHYALTVQTLGELHY